MRFRKWFCPKWFWMLAALTALSLAAPAARAQQATQHGIELTWTESTSGVTGYDVWRATTSGGPYTQINSAAVTATDYLDPAAGLTAGTTYYYVVTALIGMDSSAASAQASAAVPSGGFPANPAAPGSLTAAVQ